MDLPGQQNTGLPGVPNNVPNGQPVVFAQGRASKMITLADLPDPEETPEATGDLSAEEEAIFALCMQGIKQFESAWWVMGKSLANINGRRLYRKTHASFEEFAKEVFDKSRPTAYEEITSYRIGELLSARADKAFEGDSNDVSARADITIGKKAAGALNTVTKDYGPEVSVAVHETIKDATGRELPVRELKGVIKRLPRKKDEELSQEELMARARELASQAPAAEPKSVPSALDGIREAVARLEAAHRALAPSKVKQAIEEDPVETARLLEEAKKAAEQARNRATQK